MTVSNRSVLAACGLIVTGLLTLTACGSDEGVTPTACPELELFDIHDVFDGGADGSAILSQGGYREAVDNGCVSPPGYAVDDASTTATGGSGGSGGTGSGGAAGSN